MSQPLRLSDISIVPDDSIPLSGHGDAWDDQVRLTPVKGPGNTILGYYVGSDANQLNDSLNPRAAHRPEDALVRDKDGPNDGTVQLFDANKKKIAELQVTSGFGNTTRIAFAQSDSTLGSALDLEAHTNPLELLERYKKSNTLPMVFDTQGAPVPFKGFDAELGGMNVLLGSKRPADHSRMKLPLAPDDFDVVGGRAVLKNHDVTITEPVDIMRRDEERFVRAFFMAHHNTDLEHRNDARPDEAVLHAEIMQSVARTMSEGRG